MVVLAADGACGWGWRGARRARAKGRDQAVPQRRTLAGDGRMGGTRRGFVCGVKGVMSSRKNGTLFKAIFLQAGCCPLPSLFRSVKFLVVSHSKHLNTS